MQSDWLSAVQYVTKSHFFALNCIFFSANENVMVKNCPNWFQNGCNKNGNYWTLVCVILVLKSYLWFQIKLALHCMILKSNVWLQTKFAPTQFNYHSKSILWWKWRCGQCRNEDCRLGEKCWLGNMQTADFSTELCYHFYHWALFRLTAVIFSRAKVIFSQTNCRPE